MGSKILEMGCTSQLLWDIANSGSSWDRMFGQPWGAWGQELLHPGLQRSSGEEGAGAEPAWAKAALKQMEERMHGKG